MFGQVREVHRKETSNCQIWTDTDPQALIYGGRAHGIEELIYRLFVADIDLLDKPWKVLSCALAKKCLNPEHLRILHEGSTIRITDTHPMELVDEDHIDMKRLHVAGVSKRTLKRWYQITSDELRHVLGKGLR